jgi:hypothetical protein
MELLNAFKWRLLQCCYAKICRMTVTTIHICSSSPSCNTVVVSESHSSCHVLYEVRSESKTTFENRACNATCHKQMAVLWWLRLRVRLLLRIKKKGLMKGAVECRVNTRAALYITGTWLVCAMVWNFGLYRPSIILNLREDKTWICLVFFRLNWYITNICAWNKEWILKNSRLWFQTLVDAFLTKYNEGHSQFCAVWCL